MRTVTNVNKNTWKTGILGPIRNWGCVTPYRLVNHPIHQSDIHQVYFLEKIFNKGSDKLVKR
jgi:hypothetical protein